MNRGRRPWLAPALMGLVINAVLASTVVAAPHRGSIRGIVIDSQGNPLVGAMVAILADAEADKPDKVVRQATTDTDGKFAASNIVPGRYRVKAEADGFTPVELNADVRPNKVTVFDSILLRRVSTLNDTALLNADPKYAARRAKGTIFQLDDATNPKNADVGAVALTDKTPELHGAVHTFAQTSPGTGFPSSFVGANFAVSEQIGKDINIVVGGQAGRGTGAPQSLRAITTVNANDRHQLSVALGYGRFTFSRQSVRPRLGQFVLSATDTWQVSGPVLVVYGVELSRFSEGASNTAVLPRLGVAIDAAAKTRLFASLVPGASSDDQSRFNLESGEVEFTEPHPVAFRDEAPVLERSYRLEFGGEQILSDKSSVEVMGFLDTVSGHGVGLFAIPNDNPDVSSLQGQLQSGRTRGIRVVYHRKINSAIDGSVGYAIGQGQQLDKRGISDPASLFSESIFQVVSAKVDASFVRTGTRVSTVLRFAPARAVFAIDPFQGQISTYDPNLSVSLSQELPSIGFIPGQWAAVIDLRNVFDQQGTIADDRQELIASRYHRLIRVGLSFRF